MQRNDSAPPAHPAVEAFYQELTAKHPEIDIIPDDKIGFHGPAILAGLGPNPDAAIDVVDLHFANTEHHIDA